MKRLLFLLLIVLFISCKQNNHEKNEAFKSYYGTWYRLNEKGNKILVYNYGDNKIIPIHCIILTKDSICDNYPMEQSCWKNTQILIKNDTAIFSDIVYMFLQDSISDIALISLSYSINGEKKANDEKYLYKKLNSLDNFPKEIIRDEYDTIDYVEPQNEEEFLNTLDEYTKQNPNFSE